MDQWDRRVPRNKPTHPHTMLCLFILFMGFSRQEYWSGLPFPSPVDHVLSELCTMTHPSWVALHGMAHSSIELDRLWSMWSVWLVFCDCGFHSVCPLMDKDKRIMEAYWWERLIEGETWKVKVKSLSPVWLFATPWTVAYQSPQSMEFSQQEYWSGSPFPSPGDLPKPGIKSGSPALQAEALLSEPPGKPKSRSREEQ